MMPLSWYCWAGGRASRRPRGLRAGVAGRVVAAGLTPPIDTDIVVPIDEFVSRLCSAARAEELHTSRITRRRTLFRAPRLTLRPIRIVELHWCGRPAHAEVDHLDKHRKAHREVDVALRNVHPESLADERDADEQ